MNMNRKDVVASQAAITSSFIVTLKTQQRKSANYISFPTATRRDTVPRMQKHIENSLLQ